MKMNDIATATIKLSDFDTGQEIQALKGHVAPVMSIAFSPEGRLIASGCMDGTVRILIALLWSKLILWPS